MNIEIAEITPAYAAELLKQNTNNRPVRPSHVRFLSEAMQRGEFLFNGDAIRISKDNVILDGQHRLLAVVKSNIALKVVVVRGLESEVFKTIDVDKLARTSGQVLGLHGIKNYNGVAASARLYFLLKQNSTPFVSTNSPSATQILNLVEEKPLIAECVSHVCGMVWVKKYLNISWGGFLLTVFAEKNREKAFEFMNALESGAELSNDNPAYLLRERIMSDFASVNKKADREYHVKLAFRAFDYFLKGKKVKFLKVLDGSKTTDPYTL